MSPVAGVLRRRGVCETARQKRIGCTGNIRRMEPQARKPCSAVVAPPQPPPGRALGAPHRRGPARKIARREACRARGRAFALRAEARVHGPVPRRWDAGIAAARGADDFAAWGHCAAQARYARLRITCGGGRTRRPSGM